MDALIRDLRTALRVLFARRRGSTLVVVLVLGMGIGATVAIFNMINAMLLRPLPYHDAERLITLHESHPELGVRRRPLSSNTFLTWRDQNQVLEDVAAYARRNFDASHDEAPERVAGARITANLFTLLGVAPVLGRDFAAGEDAPGRPPLVLLSHLFWERRFGGDPAVVGRMVLLDGVPHEVIGVMPPGFAFPEWSQLWTTAELESTRDAFSNRWLATIARLRPGITPAEARDNLAVLAQVAEEVHPELRGWTAHVLPLRQDLMPSGPRMGLYTMLVAVGCLLLIVTVNVAAVVLAGAVARRPEFAIRAALGANRTRLVRQLLTENLLLALLGGLVGLFLSVLAVRLMVAAVPIQIPFWIDFSLDGRVLLFTLALTLGTGLLFGTALAWRATNVSAFETIREGAGMSGGVRRMAALKLLVTTEFALSFVLLVAAVLMSASIRGLEQSNPGFAADNVLTLRLSLNSREYQEPERRAALVARVLEHVREVPGVEAAGAVEYLPVSPDGWGTTTVAAEGRALRPGEEPPITHSAASAGYLQTMRIPMLRGRDFTPQEAETGAPVAVVSATLAGRLWPGLDPLGRRMRTARMPPGEWLTVIGVAGPIAVDQPMLGIDPLPQNQLYVPYPRSFQADLTLAVRTHGDPADMAASVRQAVWSVDPNVPLYSVLTMREAISRVLWLPRFWGQIFSAFGLLALLIAAIGLYGVVAYSTKQRTREMAIRLAVGATPSRTLRLVLLDQGRTVAIAVVIGLALALLGMRAVSGLLYGISYADPLVYSVVGLALLGVAGVAALGPAWRAARTNPATAMRAE